MRCRCNTHSLRFGQPSNYNLSHAAPSESWARNVELARLQTGLNQLISERSTPDRPAEKHLMFLGC
jgi:hypothetical protein